MVSKPASSYRLPTSPQPIGRLLESSLMLWLASWRQTFWYSLLYGVANLLPGLTLGDLAGRMLRHGLGVTLGQALPWLPLGGADDPMVLVHAALDWLRAPATWLVGGASLLLALTAITLLIHRQHRVGCGDDPGLAVGTQRAATRVPAALAAWLVYLALLVLLTLPLLVLAVLVFQWSLSVDLFGLLLLTLGFLLGGMLLSVPLVWISVAAGFAPVIATVEAVGPLHAQRRSMTRVRGHWVRSAVVVTVPMLIYLGIGSTLSSIAMVACGSIAFSLGGWLALMEGDWLPWSQLAIAIPMAIALPLASAGFVVGWHDLVLRHTGAAESMRPA